MDHAIQGCINLCAVSGINKAGLYGRPVSAPEGSATDA